VPAEGGELRGFAEVVDLRVKKKINLSGRSMREKEKGREERRTRTWISLSSAAAYTLAPSALQHTAVTGHPTSNSATGTFPPSSPPSHTRTSPSSAPVTTSSVPLPPAIVRSTLLMISRCARILRTRCPVVTSRISSV
jgi:hypothetical protein